MNLLIKCYITFFFLFFWSNRYLKAPFSQTWGRQQPEEKEKEEEWFELIALSINVPLLCSLWLFVLEV